MLLFQFAHSQSDTIPKQDSSAKSVVFLEAPKADSAKPQINLHMADHSNVSIGLGITGTVISAIGASLLGAYATSRPDRIYRKPKMVLWCGVGITSAGIALLGAAAFSSINPEAKKRRMETP